MPKHEAKEGNLSGKRDTRRVTSSYVTSVLSPQTAFVIRRIPITKRPSSSLCFSVSCCVDEKPSGGLLKSEGVSLGLNASYRNLCFMGWIRGCLSKKAKKQEITDPFRFHRVYCPTKEEGSLIKPYPWSASICREFVWHRKNYAHTTSQLWKEWHVLWKWEKNEIS